MIIYAAGAGGGMEIDMAGIYGNGIALTERVLDNLWTRQTVTLNNIANNDTPGFKSQFVTFEEELASKLSKADLSGGNKWERRLIHPARVCILHITSPRGLTIITWIWIKSR